MIFDWDADDIAPPLAAQVMATHPEAAPRAARYQVDEHMKAVAQAMGQPTPIDDAGQPMNLQALAVFAGHLQEAGPTDAVPAREYTVVTASSSGSMFTDYVLADSPTEAFCAADDHYPIVFIFPGHHQELLHDGQLGSYPAGRGTSGSGKPTVVPQQATEEARCACGCRAAEHIAANAAAVAALSCTCEQDVPGACPAMELVRRVFEILDGPEEWDSDHIEFVANEFQRWGFYIRDPSEHPDPSDELAET